VWARLVEAVGRYGDPPYRLESAPDGKRFLAVRDLPAKFKVNQVCVILNWFEELKAKVPTGSR